MLKALKMDFLQLQLAHMKTKLHAYEWCEEISEI